MPDANDAREVATEIARLFEQRRFADALPLAREWCALEPARWVPFADRAVAAKHAAEFSECLDASLRAIELAAEHVGSGLHWNLGIAATAVGDWPRARAAWKACGIDVPGTEGPIYWKLGLVPIRIALRECPEVVWCDRVCPARAIIRSVPLPETGRRFGDVLLHDGEPRGKRFLHGRECSVFDELAVLERSPDRTRVIRVTAPGQADVDALGELLAGIVVGFEDWTASLEILCKSCSEGVPHERHDAMPDSPWQPSRRIAIASRDCPGDAVLARWERGGAGRSITAIED